MYKLLIILSLSLCYCTVYAKNEELDGQSLYQIKVQNTEQVDVLNKIIRRLVLDVWSYAAPGREGLVLVPREKQIIFQKELYEAGITYKIGVENIKESVDLEDKLLAAAASTKSNRSHPGLPFDRIHRYTVVDQYLVELANLYPDLVKVVSGGTSFEGRDIKYLKISTTNFEDKRKPVIVIMSLLHAREWVTLPPTLYAIEKLVIDVTEPDLVEDIDWVILPIANPDGYEFSHTRNRFWRKNRVIIPGSRCLGVDLNRNFAFNWGVVSSDNPCTEDYHGDGPFSEFETQIVRDILSEHRNRVEMFIDVHSFGSMILYGLGTGQLPPNALTLNLVGVYMARGIDAVKWPEKRNYIVGHIVAIFSIFASGISSDYAQSQNVPLSYIFELPAYRDNDFTIEGFLVDPAFIEQAGFETWEGIKVGARWVVQNTRSKQVKLETNE